MQMKPQSDQRLEGRVAIVTGVGRERGIGRAIGLRYAEEGARVALLDLDAGGADRVADEIRAAGGTAIAVPCDVTDLSACEAAAARVADELSGRVDILVNNAAWLDEIVWLPFDEWTVEEWDKMLDVNLRGMWFCARAFVPAMKARSYGKIINVTSSTFWEGVGGFIHYTSSKGGVIGFTRALGRELGPLRHPRERAGARLHDDRRTDGARRGAPGPRRRDPCRPGVGARRGRGRPGWSSFLPRLRGQRLHDLPDAAGGRRRQHVVTDRPRVGMRPAVISGS
jgi:NADP-dependent 3-hydroxy acid dehydrogenase YdfG